MVASYRLQLRPEFTFSDVAALVPYFQRLGVSHLYLSPITESRAGSTHGYDVIDHNAIREELGGRAGFDEMLTKVQEAGLELILDFVPNHAGVGPRNAYWQDVLAYGRHSPYTPYFDIDWDPLKPELHGKILLPFLGTPYGEALDSGEISLILLDGRFYARYYENRFALSPVTYAEILRAILPSYERQEVYFDLKDMTDAYAGLSPREREKAETLRSRLISIVDRMDGQLSLDVFEGSVLHDLLEQQYWRLSFWKTAGYEINYRRFFDINGLVALRMEDEEVFWDAHRLLGELLTQSGVAGVRIDHVDGLFDPHAYLNLLRDLGAPRIWVEKILAHGETLPDDWPVEGTTGYEFMNDAMAVLVDPDGEIPLDRTYSRFVPDAQPYQREAYYSKVLVMETSLSSELFRLSYELDRISEADYHTRDFTLEALRQALAETVAAFDRYRTYLPYDEESAREVIDHVVHKARQNNPAAEPTVYSFIASVIMGDVREDLKPTQRAWIGRFQQYTAPVAAKGVEDTAFYRYHRLAALSEVGGEPDLFGEPLQAFHSHARFRAHRYPRNMVATATHDHKRGEDTRMRLIALSEISDKWDATVHRLAEIADAHRGHDGVSKADEYLSFQIVAALWHGANRSMLADRLVEYMLKASRESKRRTSWVRPDEAYEKSLTDFIRGMMSDDRLDEAIGDISTELAGLGYFNSLSQLVLKFTTPGVPDIYQGTELIDLSLVDPDNRRPVDYGERLRLLDEFAAIVEPLDTEVLQSWLDNCDGRLKMYIMTRLLELRSENNKLFLEGSHRPLTVSGDAESSWIAYSRELDDDAILVLVPRFPSRWPAHKEACFHIPKEFEGCAWREILTGKEIHPSAGLEPALFDLPWIVLKDTRVAS